MRQKIHHINFIVADLETAIPTWEQLLDQPVVFRDQLADRGVETAGFDLGGTWLVLVQPTRRESVPGRYLAEHGEGFFLLSLGVDSLDDAARRLGEHWFSGPARTGLNGWQIRDIDRARTAGAQFQLTQDTGRPFVS